MNLLSCSRYQWADANRKTIMKTIKFTCLALLILTLPAARGEPFRTDINPALLYYRAFLLVPEPMSNADEEFTWSKEGKEKKLPERFGKIVADYDNQFKLVREAAQQKVPCDWGIDFSPGPNIMLPHLGRAKAVAQASHLRALWALQHGRQEDARDDLLAAFVLGRNAGNDPIEINVLVQFAIEALEYGTVANCFGEFSPETLKQLADGFDAAPARHLLAPCIPGQQRFVFDWALRKLSELQKAYPHDEARVMASFHEILPEAEGATNFWPRIAAAAGGTSEGVANLLREAKLILTRVAEVMALPQAEYEAQAKPFFAECRKSQNPFIAESIRGWENVRPREFRVQAQQAMVRAAVEYKLHGEAGLKSVMDPFGNGPFGLQRFVFKGVDRGFELKSAYAGGGAPFVLIFVEKQGPAFQITGPDAGKAIDK
jgi:hypothetical protein